MKYLPPNRKGTRLAAALALTAAASLTLAACGGGGNAGSPQAQGSASGGGGGGAIAVTLITKDNNNPFWISMQKGAEDAASKNGVTLTKAAGAKDCDEDGQVKAI
jgi:fructose transport system substrate-binding protein